MFFSIKENMLSVDNKSEINEITEIYNQLQESVMPNLSDALPSSSSRIIKSCAKSNVGTTAKKDNFNLDIQFIALDNSFAKDLNTGTDLLIQVNEEISNSNNYITIKSVVNKTLLMVTPYRNRKTMVVMNEHERKVLDIIAPMLFKFLFLKNGPLDKFISISKSKSRGSSGIIERLVGFRHDIDLVTMWTNLLNMEESTTGTLSAELTLQKMSSTESNNIMSDFSHTLQYRKLSDGRQALQKSNARPTQTSVIKKKVWAQNTIKLMKKQFNVRKHMTDLFESMLWTVAHTHIWNTRPEWKKELRIQELEKGFESNITSISIGMGLCNNNTDVEEGVKHLIDIHDTMIRILNISVNHNPPTLIDYGTYMGEFLEHINMFLNAVLGVFQPDIYKTMTLLLSCVLSYQSLHHTDKHVTYNSVKTLIGKYTKALESQLESFYSRYETNIESNLSLGYEIMEDIIVSSSDPSKSIDTLIYDAVSAKTKDTSKVGVSKSTKRKFSTDMIHPLVSFIMFTMYMYQLHKHINVKSTQKIKPIMLSDITSIVPTPDDLQVGVWEDIVEIITQMCTGNRNGYREIPEKLNQFDTKSLFALCIVLNNMIAYSNGTESPFSPSNIYKNLYFTAVNIHEKIINV